MSIYNSLKPDGRNQLRPFDLSHRDIFSVKSGVLNVNLIQHTIPESQYDVSHAQITRVDPVQTAAFARMSENYEYYFVPYSQIFHDFERMYYERGDVQRNYGNLAPGSDYQGSPYVPTFGYSQVMAKLADFYVASRVWLYARVQDPVYLDDIKGQLAANFQKYNPNNWIMPFDVHGEICIDEMIKLFDMLGYGNLYPLFSSLFDPFFDVTLAPITDVITTDDVTAYNLEFKTRLEKHFGYNVSGAAYVNYPGFANALYDNFKLTTTGAADTVVPAYSLNGLTLRSIFDALANTFQEYLVSNGDGEYSSFLIRTQDLQDYRPNILALASYVKVFADIYRNTQYDLDNYAALFNFDYVQDSLNAQVATNTVLMMLTPRFRQYKKDLFTGTFPNAQFGSVAVSSLQNPVNIVARVYNTTSRQTVSVSSSDGKVMNQVDSGTFNRDFDINSGVSALAIRQALSLQRYKERILRAGNRLTALQNAVFGDKSRFIEDAYVQFIGAEKNQIDFNSVAATSDAGTSEVGQLGANAVGTHVGKAFKFHSHDFGILIGIYYVLPESEYEAYMIDPQNQKFETNDYYKPDFMNLGLSPVWNYDYNFLIHTQQVGDVVLGYLANYWEYKTNIDKVHGNFYGSLPFERLSGGSLDAIPNLPTAMSRMRGQNSYYVTPRDSRDLNDGMNIGVLYVSPHDIDSIFYVDSDFTLNTDQFKVNCNHEIRALLPMSVVGLPEY